MQKTMVDGFRLSPQQERLWLIQQEAHHSAFHSACAVLVEGPLSKAVLQAALQSIVTREELLRTTFHRLAEMAVPVQVIGEEALVALDEYDLSGLSLSERDAEISARFEEAIARVVDFDQGPLMRCSIFTLARDEYLLLLSLPAICSDLRGLTNLIERISSTYDACLRGEAVAGETLQYADVSQWQHELLEAEETRAGREYWHKQDFTAALKFKLPFEESGSTPPDFTPRIHSAVVESRIAARITSLAKQFATTSTAILVACWQTLLWRLSDRPEIVIGIRGEGRNYEGLGEALGLFAMYLPLGCSLAGDQSFGDVVRQCANNLGEASLRQEFFTWEKEKDPETSCQTQFFPVSFDFNELPRRISVDALSFSILSQHSCIDRFKLKLSCSQSEDRLLTEFHYDARILTSKSVRRIADCFQVLLESVTMEPEQTLGRLRILSDAERHELLVEFNHTRREYPLDFPVHLAFAQQAARTPDSIALSFLDQHLSYRELDERSNQLARHLQRCGIGPEIKVGIYMAHSIEMLIAILGVLKAGAAYLPLDPSQPSKRLAFILNETQAPLILTQERLRDALPVGPAQVLCLETQWAEIADRSTLPPESTSTAENLAYVIYTSGSTGVPKGVLTAHRSLANYIYWASEVYLQGESLDFALYSSLAFDLTVTAIFTPLTTGNRIFIYDQAEQQSALAAVAREDKVGVLKLTPSHLMLLRDEEPGEGRLRRMIVGGEALPTELAHAVQERFGPELAIYNEYGPTEATVGCMIYRYESGVADGHASVAIGRPAGNARVYVLDEWLEPVSGATSGELYIGGEGLARGYLERPELTAEKFVPDPFSDQAGMRLYRTGDMARLLSNGEIEFIGRLDTQVKVRGFRIELGEISFLLNQHPHISASVVCLQNDQYDNEALVAYYVSTQRLDPEHLRQQLLESLMEEATPHLFMAVERLPLTANGKIDYAALPSIQEVRRSLTHYQVLPRTETEKLLSQIWSDVLGIEQIGIHDNFFVAGGHSLLATRVISRVRDLFQVELPLRSIFDAPTIAQLAEKIDDDGKASQQTPIAQLLPTVRDGHLPLSFAQQRLWILDQIEPNSSSYTMPLAVRLNGALDVEALERTLSEIISRHEALRTTFADISGEPVQVIGAAEPISLPVLDLSCLPELQREEESRRLIAEEALRPFNLAQGPLLRTTLLRIREDEHIVLLTMHHIVTDGWSLGVLVEEVVALYQAFITGQESPLAELPIQYADYAVWQRARLQREVLEQELNYWCEQLAGAPAVLELPQDNPRPPIQSYRGASQSLQIAEETRRSLIQLSQSEGVTLFMTLLAACQLLLARYSGQTDIVVGTPIAGRNRAETENLIGFFVNTLVMRTDLGGDPTFSELLGRVREVCLGAYAHQELPFEKLVDELQPERDMSRNPVFQVMFILQNAPQQQLSLPGLQLTTLGADVEAAKFDLTLAFTEQRDSLWATVNYQSELFEAETMERMSRHLVQLLEALSGDPSQRISSFTLLTAAEREQILYQWNDTARDFPRHLCIHDIFQQQVELTPQSIALIFGDRQLSYQELNESANQLAHYLRAQGVGPEVLVGMLMTRSVETIVSLLAILKAGGAYLPLDPAYPSERLRFMLADTGAPVVVTKEQWREQVPDGVRTVCLDSQRGEIAQHSVENPLASAAAENLAYVTYTSGSTGIPKGVMITHQNVLRLVLNTEFAWLSADEVFLQAAVIAFDASTFEIWGSLLHGAQLVMLASALGSLAEIGRSIREHQVSTLWLTAGLFHQMVEHQLGDLGGVRQLLAGGEVLSLAHVNRYLAEKGEGNRLINGYGPTESTTFATTYAMGGERVSHRSVPIGRPIANTQVYVLDERMEVVPIGVCGELHIGGMGLARGYLGGAELTAEKFVPHPFSGEVGARLYRTGDIVRAGADGQIEFVGRRDEQVKIRGFRVELGEIETVLREHEAIKEVLVLARQEPDGEKRVVGYVVKEVEAELNVTELREYVKQRLPEYMVPSWFVMLQEMPLTPNGKIDRQRLPAVERQLNGDRYVAPRTTVEETLVRVWSEVLRIERVGIHDNFFELGGDSILSIQIVSRVSNHGIQLTPRQLFQHQTIHDLAAAAQTRRSFSAEPGIVTGPLPLTPIQRWFFEQQLPEPHHFNQSVLLEVPERLNLEILEEAVQQLLIHHDALRLRFVQGEAGWEQSNAGAEEQRVFSVVDRSNVQDGDRVAAIEAAASDVQRSLNLTKGPLVRVAYINLGEASAGRLLLVIHHLAVDGVSWRLLLEDLQRIYGQLSSGAAAQLPPKTSSFRQWAHYLKEYAVSGVLEAERDYWLDERRSKVAHITVDHPEGKNTVASAKSITVSLSEEETRALLQEVPAVYHTQINDVLLTALAQAFKRWTGERVLLLEMEGHGREQLSEDLDVSRTVGWFTTIYPVLLELPAAGDEGEALKTIKEQLRRVPQQGIGYGLLRYLGGETEVRARLAAQLQAEVSFNYLGQFDQTVTEPSLLKAAQESSGEVQSNQGHRRHLLEVLGSIRGERLHLTIIYSEQLHRRPGVEHLAQSYRSALLGLIRYCRKAESGGYTPSDFPLANLDQRKLDRLVGGIS